MSWWKPNTKHITKGNVVFLFAGLVFTVLLAAFLVQELSSGFRLPTNASFTEIRPDIAKLLPAGAQWNDDSVVAVESLASDVPSYVVAYLDGGALSVRHFPWDQRESAFVAASLMDIGPRDLAAKVPRLEAFSLGAGRPTAIVIEDAGPAYSVLVVDGLSGMRLATLHRADADVVAKEMLLPSGKGSPIQFHDVNSDGAADLLVGVAGTDDSDVYEWQDGSFVYSERLSWAMVMSKQLFPEPPQAQASEIDDKVSAE